jgi:hypothetical protein
MRKGSAGLYRNPANADMPVPLQCRDHSVDQLGWGVFPGQQAKPWCGQSVVSGQWMSEVSVWLWCFLESMCI